MDRTYYILKGKLAVPAKDFMEWARWFEANERHVATDRIGGVWVSTVFLGINHNYGDGLPLLFETMIFRGGSGQEQYRCGTWQEAEKQHADAVAKVRAEIKDKVND